MFHALDQSVLELAAGIVRQSPVLDRFVMEILITPTFKMAPLVICLWALWFAREDKESLRLQAVTAALAGAMAMVVSRLIQNLAPERARPIHSGNPDYVMPYGMDGNVLRDWSSFPSDNAALAVALAAGIFGASRRMGTFCLAWSLIIICLPRIYGGLHYASDILGGIVIGLLCYGVSLLLKKPAQRLLTVAETIQARQPPVFYGLLFLCSFQLVTMFADVRTFGRFLHTVFG